ncbi:ABC transporter permease [Clostridium luticellarii]|jgi:peptide/nickel transport system permease protein|uniref:Dipeptide transport system permease protein DppB n=1 Tax=Clostridium luticellarii TaxID=1691940 RepID=A0A2T0BNR2_9CLOT|nr:ABC transporter permease [Clostridium luticellarii]MCI1944381.1 ABC transporter permease [Clostridium luticellarii]MCI1967501.1 ABC transporter permease [Clostridium luticellarii]MCI1995013.1 ABC transporter permease [Clostridium luticellarii]MCI2039548.1 ABC transporter permease [Clostridium luticellarii]PRR85462.1 Dipeptide transport system permease protein DppB [Clostridium luticellarii]
MGNYILRRILISIPVLLGVTIISFVIINMAPGSPLDKLIDPNLTAADIAARKAALGLDGPLYARYLAWLGNVLHGNLGYSMTSFQPVSELIGQRILPTFVLMGAALIIGFVIAIPLGVLSATKQYSKLDYISTTGSLIGISVPTFFLGLVFIYIFSLKLKLLPSGGMITLGQDNGFVDRLRHLILPAVVLGVNEAGTLVRYVRSSMLEILDQDYLRTARSKGLKESIVINKHAFKNAMLPIITITGLEIVTLLGGSVVTEQIFQWPGIGQLTISSVMSRDYTTLMGLILFGSVVCIVANLLIDIIYSIVDPRIRYN